MFMYGTQFYVWINYDWSFKTVTCWFNPGCMAPETVNGKTGWGNGRSDQRNKTCEAVNVYMQSDHVSERTKLTVWEKAKRIRVLYGSGLYMLNKNTKICFLNENWQQYAFIYQMIRKRAIYFFNRRLPAGFDSHVSPQTLILDVFNQLS